VSKSVKKSGRAWVACFVLCVTQAITSHSGTNKKSELVRLEWRNSENQRWVMACSGILTQSPTLNVI